MLDAIFSELRELARSWQGEVKERREITQDDPVADTIENRSRLLERKLQELEKHTERLTPSQYAELHGTTPQTVTAWCRAGKIRCVPNGRSYLIPRSSMPPRSRAGQRARKCESIQ